MRIQNPLKRLVTSIHSILSRPKAWPEENHGLSTKNRGGYYSASPRTILHARYVVLKKLGWGQHSNVWLARDKETQEYAAIKILSAHATQVQGKVSYEREILEKIQRRGTESIHPGFYHVLSLHDHFILSSKHGNHLCMVTDVLGTTLLSLRDQLDGSGFPIHLVKKITSQCLLALDFLHSECEVIHTDIKLDNIHISTSNVNEALKQEEVAPDTTKSRKPLLSCSITSITTDEAKDPGADIHIRLTDFGTAAFFKGFHADVIQPAALRAPEVIIGCEWDRTADIWNLGCLVFELLTGRWLFNPRSGESFSAGAYHLAHMGPLVDSDFDPSFVRSGSKYSEYFFETGELRLRADGAKNIESILRVYKIDEAELPVCASFLRAMLQLNPAERATAQELLQHEWLKA